MINDTDSAIHDVGLSNYNGIYAVETLIFPVDNLWKNDSAAGRILTPFTFTYLPDTVVWNYRTY